MADYLLSIGTLSVFFLALRWIGLRLTRSPASRRRARLVTAVSVALAVLITAGTLYRLSKSRTLQLAGEMLDRVETAEKAIALTFDDGPTPQYTPVVLDILARHRAKGTFFIIGQEGLRNMEDLRAIVAAGHQVGNHTWTHPRLLFLSAGRVAEEFESTDRVIVQSGFSGPILVRTPFGKRLLTAPLYLAENRRVNVFWDCEPESRSDLADDPEKMAAHVVENVGPGSIVLLHVMYASREASRRALPIILQTLEMQQYRFVTVNELLELSSR